MFYSASTKGFYPYQYADGPFDLVGISDDYHLELLSGESSGLVITTSPEGSPILSVPEDQPVSVPARVTMRQARLALHAAGLLAGVEAAIDALPEPPRTSARIEWDYSSEVYRHKPFVVMLGQALDLTDEQIDDLFITAASL